MKHFKSIKISVLSILLLVSYFAIGQELETSIFVTANTADDFSVLTQISDEAKTIDNSKLIILGNVVSKEGFSCLLYTSPSPRDKRQSRMPSSA